MSKVPKNMGSQVQQELQNALNQWRDEVFNAQQQGYLRNTNTQKIKRQK